jgi:ribosomal protein S14
MASLAQNIRDEKFSAPEEKWLDPRVRTQCKECGHLRSEHHSIYNAVAGDYLYTYCNEQSCGCYEFVEHQVKSAGPARRLNLNNPPKNLEARCRTCGSEQANHINLGPECVATCEMNWKMLDKLRRAGLISTANV